MLPAVDPMLAGRGVPSDGLDAYAVEPKLDGWRVMVSIEPGAVTVRTRHGRNITERVPGLAALGDAGFEAILDGELVAGAGRASDFYRIGSAFATPLGRSRFTFVAFDLVWLEGHLLTDETYEARRKRLEDLDLVGAAVTLPRWDWTVAPALFSACEEHGVEGVVLKRLDSRYYPGARSDEWRKLKTRQWFETHAEHRRPR